MGCALHHGKRAFCWKWCLSAARREFGLWFSRGKSRWLFSNPVCAALINPSLSESPLDFKVGWTLSIFMWPFLGRRPHSLIGSGIWPEPAGRSVTVPAPLYVEWLLVRWDGRWGWAKSAVANRSVPPESSCPLVLWAPGLGLSVSRWPYSIRTETVDGPSACRCGLLLCSLISAVEAITARSCPEFTGKPRSPSSPTFVWKHPFSSSSIWCAPCFSSH